jgi:hypothetical protein
MIDDNELQALARSTGADEPLPIEALHYGERVLIAAPHLLLDVPAAEVRAEKFTGRWISNRLEDPSKWRDLGVVPRDMGVRAQVMRDHTAENKEFVRLETDNATSYMHVPVYEFMCRQYFRPTFYVHAGDDAEGKPLPITVYEALKLVAVIAPCVLKLKDGWAVC